jgi:hypothetical protein
MNRNLKLLALAFAVLIVLVGVETFILVTIQAKGSQTSLIRVACVGDSITAGTEYPVDLRTAGTQLRINSFGIGGATVALERTLLDQSNWFFQKLHSAEILVLTLGTTTQTQTI